jgi:large subunit ribosomal protein L3
METPWQNLSSAPLGLTERSVPRARWPSFSSTVRSSSPPSPKKEPAVPSKAIVGEKVGMTQVWDDHNRAVAVTVVRVTPMRVVQLKTPDRDGYSAVQVTYGVRKARTLSKPQAGHYAAAGDGVDPGRGLVELRVADTADYQVGQELTVGILSAGDKVDVTAVSKGKGFSGGMKRHNFKGQGASHGNHKHHRAPGSVGACATPSRVFKGTRMAGQLGAARVTTLNLEVVQADAERNLLLLKGAVPGPRGGMVLVRDAVKGGK